VDFVIRFHLRQSIRKAPKHHLSARDKVVNWYFLFSTVLIYIQFTYVYYVKQLKFYC